MMQQFNQLRVFILRSKVKLFYTQIQNTLEGEGGEEMGPTPSNVLSWLIPCGGSQHTRENRHMHAECRVARKMSAEKSGNMD